MTDFTWPVRVYYEDTDAGGVVYHSNYINFMERARTEWLRALGFEQDELKRNQNVLFVVRSIKVDFIRPARFNDLLDVTVAVKHTGRASLTLAQAIRLHEGGNVLCHGEVRVASISADAFRPIPVPDMVLAVIAGDHDAPDG